MSSSVFPTDWLMLSMLAVFVSISIHGLLYAISRAFNLRELEMSSKSEILQALATAFLAIFFTLIVGGVSDYVNSHIYGTVACGDKVIKVSGIDSALQVVQCNIIEKAKKLQDISNNIRDNADIKFEVFYSSFSIMGLPVWSGQYLSGLYRDIEELRFKNSMVTTFLIALNALITLVAYVKSNMLVYFLPFGVLLRSFHFTRGIGSLFISLAVGFYFVFPYVFLISDPTFVKLPEPPAPPKPAGSNFCYPTFSSVLSMVSYTQQTSTVLLSSGLSSNLGRLYAALLIHPLVALFSTLTVVRYLMYLFGEEAYDMMRMTMRLI